MRDFDAVALLRWRSRDATSLLLVGGVPERNRGEGVLALEVARISLEDGRLRLVPLRGVGDGPAERIDVADLDGDGAEELVVVAPPDGADRQVRILSWTGNRFSTERLVLPGAATSFGTIVGDADGIAGTDLVFGVQEDRELVRVAMGASGPEVERVVLGELEGLEPGTLSWPIAVAGGRVYLYVEGGTGQPQVVRLAWPRGGEPARPEPIELDGGGFLQPMALGSRAYFIDDRMRFDFAASTAGAAAITIRDDALEVVARFSPSAAVRRAIDEWLVDGWDLMHNVFGPFPYGGSLPGGYRGAPAAIISGNLITADEAGIRVRPVGAFIGVAPVGMAGPDDGWLVLTSAIPPTEGTAYLYGAPATADGVTLVPAESAFEPEANGGQLAVEFQGAVEVGDGADAWVASPDGGFQVVVRGLPLSRVAALVSGRPAGEARIGEDGRGVLTLDPRPTRDDTVDYRATVVQLGVDGRVASRSWQGRVLRELPTLDASAATRTLALEARLEGRTDPFATVVVDGQPVAVDRQGRFGLTVEAGPAPRAVVVTATDPAGNQATQRLEVVGIVDYRGWPWAPIVGGVTVLFGVAMYLRAPRHRPLAAGLVGGEGTIEEIDGD
jgi:hypothetical protein